MNDLRQGSKPYDSYSLFGSMGYTPAAQPRGAFWGGKHFQEDEEELKSEDDEDNDPNEKRGYNLFG